MVGVKNQINKQIILVAIFIALICITWVIGEPRNAFVEENQHSFYAAGAVRGEVPLQLASKLPFPKWQVVVPGWFNNIFLQHPVTNPNPGNISTTTDVGHLPPFYYFILGLPTLFRNGMTTLYIMRLIEMLLCLGYILYAIYIYSRHNRALSAYVGILLSLTPEAYFLGATINPNGLEVFACASLFILSGVIITSELHEQLITYKSFCIVGGTLCLIRTLSPMWVIIAILYIAIGIGFKKTAKMITNKSCIKFTVFIVITGLVTFIWDLIWGRFPYGITFYLINGYQNHSFLDRVLLSSQRSVTFSIQAFANINNSTWPLATTIWLVLIVALVFLAILKNRYFALKLIMTSILLDIFVPAVFEASQGAHLGLWWEGSYSLPLYTATPILAGFLFSYKQPVLSSRLPKGQIFKSIVNNNKLIFNIILLIQLLLEFVFYYLTVRSYMVGNNGQFNILWGPIIDKTGLNWRTLPFGWQDFWIFINFSSAIGIFYFVNKFVNKSDSNEKMIDVTLVK
jgi:hypothetical protein